ncbi:50S ribosomal protein L3 [Teredinibacter sp. KSP-S5-2]|uniref:50S ribosomal protein L3 n=1 Tax=Teredinibacter sp. KSP-S5-2 TaxID=3034506 RepID=UPI002934AB0D|nr:50S ribosomal protein L3 [Teredinibacter sp. KSP-S5-2]WNO09704.1 50S ribosomal protein L3 [Teredinibacter sp. KSP-S5-2]
MTIGIVGRKSGMTRIFTEEGNSVPVTVVEVEPNRITQVKNVETDGYSAVQVAVGSRRASRVNKPVSGHYAKAQSEAGRRLFELRNDLGGEFEVGGQITVEAFEAGQKVDVTGTSKGKGFQGGVKRWNFRMQDATHGNSLSHRAPGSIGQCQTPGRVFKGKKMAGHMGAERTTTQNLEIVKVDVERNLLLIKGAVPGAPGGDIIVRPAVKLRNNG